MRQLTHFDQAPPAHLLQNVLFAQGIGSEVQQNRDGQWVVWVHDEQQLAQARQLATDYQTRPHDPKYKAMHLQALAQRAAYQQQQAQSKHKTIQMRKRWQAQSQMGLGRFTLALILISALVAIMSQLGERDDVVRHLTISSFQKHDHVVQWHGLTDVWAGQLWRLITPIFVHFGFLHLLFNMWWLKDLGSIIEHRHRTWFLAALVLSIAVISNLAQYLIEGNPLFGGMSGVVYGLLGFLWTRSHFDPSYGLRLNSQIVIFMLVWLVLGFTGWLGNVANTVHVTGLLTGVLWGYGLSGHMHRKLKK